MNTISCVDPYKNQLTFLEAIGKLVVDFFFETQQHHFRCPGGAKYSQLIIGTINHGKIRGKKRKRRKGRTISNDLYLRATLYNHKAEYEVDSTKKYYKGQ